jgi:hypothetical protein
MLPVFPRTTQSFACQPCKANRPEPGAADATRLLQTSTLVKG